MIDRLQALRLIPVVALERAADAEPLADALCAGGLPCAEITLRSEAALGSLRALAGREEFCLVPARCTAPNKPPPRWTPVRSFW